MTRRLSPRARLVVLLAGVICSAGIACSRLEETTTPPRAEARAPRPSGRIRGTVALRGAVPQPQAEPNTKDATICGQSVSVTRLALGRDNAVRHAFVYLDGVPNTEDVRPRATTEVEQKGCEYGPHVMTLPAGSDLEIVNNDPILHNVHARETTPDGPLTIFNIAQPIRGQRTKVEAPLKTPGIIALTCEAGHPWMTAYILVAGHPYVAATNDDGEFVIEHVPAGKYPIKMWHEGVRLTRIIPSLQQFEYEDPYESTQEVVVPEDGEAVVNFALELRRAE